jgi:glutamyl-tRNA synthetase
METNSCIRVRFAPSPTGPLHLGGVRTALYNYLFARKHQGTMILRIEDTDQQRFVEGAEQYIIDALHWCGIHFDEGIEQGGNHAPYRQSERSEIYREKIAILLENKHAYYAFDSPSELEAERQKGINSGSDQFQYNHLTRKKLKNSLTLPEEEVQSRINQGDSYVVRIKIPEEEVVVFHDLIRGEVKVDTKNLDDKVLFKSDGLPTYHLANVVDDYLMKITHVIRGEEWLPSAPLHLLLYRFFGWESAMPKFAHLPLILKPDGNGKLSKRDGDRLGFPVFPLQWTDPTTGISSHGYREDGYLPEAFINMLALLGWNPGIEKEIFSMQNLIDLFTIERVGKSGSKFDPEKAKWFNHQYLLMKKDEELGELLQAELRKRDLSFPIEYTTEVIRLTKERALLLGDLWTNSWFFFLPPQTYDPQVKTKIWTDNTTILIRDFVSEASTIEPFNKETLHNFIIDYTNRKQIKIGILMNPLRLLLVGSNQGPGMMDLAGLLGKDEFLARILQGIKKIG